MKTNIAKPRHNNNQKNNPPKQTNNNYHTQMLWIQILRLWTDKRLKKTHEYPQACNQLCDRNYNFVENKSLGWFQSGAAAAPAPSEHPRAFLSTWVAKSGHNSEKCWILKIHKKSICEHGLAWFQCHEFEFVTGNHPRIQHTSHTMTFPHTPLTVCETTTAAQAKSPTADKISFTIRFAVKNHTYNRPALVWNSTFQ